jgi:predicted transposase YbfD/YdcC
MNALLCIFREVRDPRDENARHDLAEMLFLALAATLCGAKTCVDIADFAAANEDSFREMLTLPHGTPSHDTFSRVFRLLDPVALEGAFTAFLSALRGSLGLPPPRGVVALDAKALKRGYERGRPFMPPLLVGVFDSQTRLALAQRRAAEGGEAGAAVDLLKSLVLKGCTVTADALHCTAETAQAIRHAKAHDALGLKGNQAVLAREAEAAFAKAGAAAPVHETQDQGHGRRERRRASVLPAAALARPATLPGLAAIGRIEATRIAADGREASAVRHLALSRRLTPRRMLEVVRAHWSIENGLHWSLDVVFDEDDARTRKDYGPENLAVIRRMAHNILRAHPADKSLSRKMNLAAWRKEFFFELFAHMQ